MRILELIGAKEVNVRVLESMGLTESRVKEEEILAMYFQGDPSPHKPFPFRLKFPFPRYDQATSCGEWMRLKLFHAGFLLF